MKTDIEVIRPRICLSKQNNKVIIEITLMPIIKNENTNFFMSYSQFKIWFPELLNFAKILETNNRFDNSDELKALKLLVCKQLGISDPLLLHSKTRTKPICIGRQLVCTVLRETNYGSLKKIGRIFKQDHATIIYGIKAIKNIIFTKDPDYYQAVVNVLNYYKITF